MIKKLAPAIALASIGLMLLAAQFTGLFFDHNHAVIASYYIYDPVTGYATARVYLYQDGCKETVPLMVPSRGEVNAVISLYSTPDRFVGKWVYFADTRKVWHPFKEDSESNLMHFTSKYTDDLLLAHNKRRPSEKFFLL